MKIFKDLAYEAKVYILGSVFTLIGVFLLYGLPITFICGGILTLIFSLLLVFLPLMYSYVNKK